MLQDQDKEGKKRKSKGGREKEKMEEYEETREKVRVVHNRVSEYK